ncbi:hypothetical protein FD755_011131 [Muntiacus reevesi]|uniref:G-patch domain-containing protein n=1 Tax=Muntiacus reevesi TaxID=9886 RepID=A0A5N3XRP4_MUNRE|nr:hypothetical protein FD755_011131 [Muntiacus reevesi]
MIIYMASVNYLNLRLLLDKINVQNVSTCKFSLCVDYWSKDCTLFCPLALGLSESCLLHPELRLQEDISVQCQRARLTLPGRGGAPTPTRGFSAGEVLIPLADEYDPMFPNDYEKVVKRQREERQRQQELERQKEIEEREKRRKDRHEASGFSRRPDPDSDEDEDYERERRKRSMGGAAIAPPTSLVEKDKELPRDFPYEEDSRPRSQSSKAAIAPPVYEEQDRPRSPTGPGNSFLTNMGGTVAHKITQKYGFREGQGLGKHEQGLSTALSVEKTSKRGGKIIVGDATEKDAAKKSDSNPLTEILKCPTKVVLRRNMVGAGEVDEDLEVETKEECEKYGKVGKCVIFELPGAPDDEASAIKDVVDLNGRYFGGRVVKACFYNLDKFRVLDLAEQV